MLRPAHVLHMLAVTDRGLRDRDHPSSGFQNHQGYPCVVHKDTGQEGQCRFACSPVHHHRTTRHTITDSEIMDVAIQDLRHYSAVIPEGGRYLVQLLIDHLQVRMHYHRLVRKIVLCLSDGFKTYRQFVRRPYIILVRKSIIVRFAALL